MMLRTSLKSWVVVNCLHVGPGPAGEVPSMGGGVFLTYPGLYLREFQRENHGKLRTDRSQAQLEIEPETFRLPVLKAEPLVKLVGFFF